MLTQGSTFTYQDVLDQLLVYTPETVSGGADEMHFTLTDGVFRQTGRLEFTMDVRKSEGPRMTVNRGLQLPAGSNSSRPSGFHMLAVQSCTGAVEPTLRKSVKRNSSVTSCVSITLCPQGPRPRSPSRT